MCVCVKHLAYIQQHLNDIFISRFLSSGSQRVNSSPFEFKETLVKMNDHSGTWLYGGYGF